MLRLILSIPFAVIAVQAQADQCRALVNGDEIVVEAENFQTFAEEVKTREKLLNWPNRTWNRTWGTPVACNSGVLYDYLATTVPDNDINGYCLTETADYGYFLVPGERNFRGLCKTTFCEKVNTTKDQGIGIAASMTQTIAQNARTAGLNAIKHGSGAMILSGTASSVSASLGTASSTAVTALSTPAVLGAAAVSVVAVGGAVYMCSGDEAIPASAAEILPESVPVAEPVETPVEEYIEVPEPSSAADIETELPPINDVIE